MPTETDPKTNQMLTRVLHPEVRVLDEAKGICEYIASDESIDCYREVIRAKGWRFNRFSKNAPFVDSHNYHTIDRLLGKVLDFVVKGDKLVETVQWAIDVEENRLAKIGWAMTKAGYLKAVSVGFFPTKLVYRGQDGYSAQLAELKLPDDGNVRCIFIEQDQIELSSCIIGANPNALLKTAQAYKAGVLSDADIETLSKSITPSDPAPASKAAEAGATKAASERWLRRFQLLVSL